MRSFIAIHLPDEIKQQLVALQRELPQDGLRLVKPGAMHLTLKFLGEISESEKEEIVEILRTISFAPFALSVKGVGVFPSENHVRVVWAGCESPGLEKLAREINEKLPRKFFGKEKFTAHLTLARVEKKIDARNFLAQHRAQEFGSFSAASFSLMKSTLTPQGPIYEELENFRGNFPAV